MILTLPVQEEPDKVIFCIKIKGRYSRHGPISIVAGILTDRNETAVYCGIDTKPHDL